MIPVKTLEIQMASVIRIGLRTAMRRVDVGNIGDPLHDAVAALESSLYAPMYAQIVKTYAEGYVNGGELIARHIRSASAILAAAAPIPAEDPRIAKATQAVVYGVRDSLKEHKNEIQAVIRDQIEKGATPRQISGDLMHYFDDNRVAADRFARTATNDIYNRAHLDRYEDSGVVDGVQFSAHIDVRTTDICIMTNGTIWALGDSDIKVPPLHFNCFIEGTRIEPTSDLVAAFRGWYDGQVVELTLADGRRLTVTPNHMLLTSEGFLASKLIHEGDNVICRPGFEGILHGVDPNDNDSHPTVEEVFGAFSVSRGVSSETMPATPVDFHNDGEFIKGNIDIITSERLLLSARNPAFVEHLDKQVLCPADFEPDSFPGAGDLTSVLFSLAYAADGCMSGVRETSAFFGGRVAHPDIHRFTAVPRSDPKFIQPRNNDARRYSKLFGKSLDRCAGGIPLFEGDKINCLAARDFKSHIIKPSMHSRDPDPETIGELLTVHPGVVELQKVVNINIIPFHGYIYDFQTISTLCISNGVVTSNCRSRLMPYWGGIPGARNFEKEFGSGFVADATKVSDTFRKSYWSPMPHTKASATYQRAYLPKNDIKTVTSGLNLVIKEERAAGGVPDIFPLQRLKDMIRYRKINAVKSTISDRFGQSLLLDKFEERDIVRAIRSLITQADSRIVREAVKRKKIVDTAWKEVLAARTGISKIEKDILYYRKRMKADPANAISYHKIITSDTKRLETLKASEQRRIAEWNKYVDMKPSATTISLKAERERYEELLKSLNFR